MAKAFKHSRRGIVGHLESGERELLRKLFEDVIGMLEPDDDRPVDPLAALVGLDDTAVEPTDSAVRRLLPNAVHDDPVESLEFRRFTERSLRETKVGALRAAAVMVENAHLELAPDQAQLLARALNDVRLVLADRLHLETEDDAAALADITDWKRAEDIETYLALVYNFVTWLQETLMQALLRGLAADGNP